MFQRIVRIIAVLMVARAATAGVAAAEGELFTRKVFGPEVCRVLEWAFGEELAAEGGRRVVCPADHTLYSCMDWVS